ncbi:MULTISPECIES: GNAT family N-acetyltransferase [Acinetobacter]|uniref:GNAT family N-acetyltransferase n=1 Tax=Acinetobacter TaxID=469 RepID=UPI000EA3B016|nr:MULTISPECIES: GNAT family N-acetyltransferase [Acinetobacter]RKG41570.1 N-acetyltransferase [Acinetobacter cumulans]RKG45311.1 N-acetyltransferase [Acinetobacter cumulans]RZG57298.1 N-acetyltransferase [Acinetobacter sp. WCHAc060006]
MIVQHLENGSKGAFYVEQQGERLAEMTYSWAGTDKFIIDHTAVSDSLRGQGVGRHLVDAAVQFARERQVKIIPLCPFAKSVFDKDPEIRDVLV